MKLYTSSSAPNPRRVAMFIAEKGIAGIEPVPLDLFSNAHKTDWYRAKNPLMRVPALELDDGRVLTETRAICTYLEGLHPQPNLMGEGFEERAFIEEADRRMELTFALAIFNAVRHSHPGLAPLEQPQFKDFGAAQAERVRDNARWLDGVLAGQEYAAGTRFTIADITAFCALEFARGLLKFRPDAEGMAHLAAWRERIKARPSAEASKG